MSTYPASTVLPYDVRGADGVAHAVELAAREQGSLLGSIVTHHEAVARAFVLGAAHQHGYPCWCTAGPVAPAEVRSWAASVPSSTTCSAPPSRRRRTC